MYKEIKLDSEWWDPLVEGEKIEGVVINIEDGVYGKEYLIDRRIEEAGIIKTPGHKVLQMLLEKVDITDRVRITYKGEKPGKPGKNPTQIYKVEVWVKEPEGY